MRFTPGGEPQILSRLAYKSDFPDRFFGVFMIDQGMIGGIAGGVIGVVGGVIGTYFGIRGTNGPRQRAFAIRIMALVWLWMAAVVAWLFLMPRPWGQLAVFGNLPVLLSIPWGNRRLARARVEDEAESRPTQDQSSVL